jgi:hypothetical protein
MQERKYTEIEDFLADESFQSWVRTNVDLEKRNMDFRKSCPRKLVQESRLWLLATKVTENNSSSIVQTALLATWNKIETNETSGKKKIKLWNNKWLGLLQQFCFVYFVSSLTAIYLLLVILPKSTMNSYI